MFQGPALYAYNDAQFEERDWEGIGKLQESVKEKEPLKVGRFGLGFKSVFHVTGVYVEGRLTHWGLTPLVEQRPGATCQPTARTVKSHAVLISPAMPWLQTAHLGTHIVRKN